MKKLGMLSHQKGGLRVNMRVSFKDTQRTVKWKRPKVCFLLLQRARFKGLVSAEYLEKLSNGDNSSKM